MDIAELRRGDFFPTLLPGKAMIHSSRRERKTKAIAEVLAMISDAHPELVRHRPRPVRETDEWLRESATEFCAALDRYAEHAMENRRPPGRARRAPRRLAPRPPIPAGRIPSERARRGVPKAILNLPRDGRSFLKHP
jgi:hypothetical protein